MFRQKLACLPGYIIGLARTSVGHQQYLEPEGTEETGNVDKLWSFIQDLEDKLSGLLTSCVEKSYYTVTHGDLTLDNILLREVRIYDKIIPGI